MSGLCAREAMFPLEAGPDALVRRVLDCVNNMVAINMEGTGSTSILFKMVIVTLRSNG